MDRFILLYIFVLIWLLPFSFGSEEEHGICMKGRHHKSKPGPESELFAQCAPWKNRSCCTADTSRSLHDPLHHNFNINHCSHVKDLSMECRRHFLQDLCFYECSPNVFPWLVEVDMKIRSERFYQVPLCKQDCLTWFDSCKYDFTCSSNWLHGWTWKNGSNYCKGECITFKEMFKNADIFCEKVWDGSWKVIQDEKPCMKIWFDGSEGNPNDAVADYYSTGRELYPNLLLIIITYLVFALFVLDIDGGSFTVRPSN